MATSSRSRSSSRSRGASTKVTVDMRDVESQVKCKDGEHLAEVAEVTREEGNAADYLKWKFKVVSGDSKGAILYNNTSLSKNSLWNLKAFLEAMGVDVPDDEIELDLPGMVGNQVMVVVEQEVYEGKRRPRIVDFFEAPDDNKKEERPRRGKDEEKDERSSRRSSRREEPEEEEERPSRRGSSKDKEDTGRRSGGRTKKDEPKPISAKDIDDMSQDELEDVIKEYDLECDLAEHRTLRKMRAAVIDAAEEAKVLEEE